MTGENELLSDKVVPESWHWHRTMTSVVAAGNGYLSSGVYRGLAPESDLGIGEGQPGWTHSGVLTWLEVSGWVTENRSRVRELELKYLLGSDIG